MKRGFIMKKAVITALILLSFALVNAQSSNFDANKAFTWLAQHSTNGNYENSVVTTAFATLALKDSGALDYADVGLEWIKQQEDTVQHCWPKGACRTKDTAFALFALSEFGEDTSDGEEWLRDALTTALRDNWYLQVITTNNGTCTIDYTVNGQAKTKTISVDAGRFPGCTGNFPNTFFNLNTCIESNLLNNNPSLELSINCNNLGPSTTLAVVYVSGNDYFLIEQAASASYQLVINNGCFGTTSGGSCNLDSTLYVNWILNTIGSDFNTFTWLNANYNNINPVENALMYLGSSSSLKDKFLNDLKGLQKPDGSFNRNVYETSIAILALNEGGSSQEAGKAVDWLETKQQSEGNLGGLLDTAAALYAAFSGAGIVLPPLLLEGEGYCGNGICDPGETVQTCSEDCEIKTEVCVPNNDCEVNYGENSENCPQDCSCGDGKCDSSESSETCSQDCPTTGEPQGAVCGNDVAEDNEECDGSDDLNCPGRCRSDCTCKPKKSAFSWIITFVIIIALVGLILFGYNKFKKGGLKGGKKTEYKPFTPSFETKRTGVPPGYRPPPPRETSSKIEDELEKSLEEAKKLLKKI